MEINQDREDSKESEISGSPGSAPIIIESWLTFAIFFLAILALGFLIVNQGLGFFYKTAFLKTPCGLCSQLNPEVKGCIDNLNSPRASFWTGQGNGTAGWSDPFNTSSYNITP